MDLLDGVNRFITSVGFPIAALVFVGWGAVKSATWLGKFAILPIVSRAVAFIDGMQESVKALTEAIGGLKELQKETMEAVRQATCRYPLQR